MLLANWWVRPTPDIMAAWPSHDDVAELASKLSPDGHPIPTTQPAEADAMLTEYERLFVGPGPVPCPPYESYWRTDVPAYLRHSLMGPCVADLARLYDKLGITVDPAAQELPDHVAVEFEAVGYALSLPPDQGVSVAAELLGHLATWIPAWCQCVNEQTRLPFYRQLAFLTPDWLAGLQGNVSTPVP